jgi:transitional endoplasmic reticulum ATPase
MTKKEKSTVETLVEKLEDALEAKMKTERSIQRGGDHIIVPEFMSLRDAVEAIQEFEHSMDEVTEQALVFKGHKYELIAAVDRGLKRSFGGFFGSSASVATFFGEMTISARSTTIPISATENISVPIGRVKVPGLPIKLTTQIKENSREPLNSQLALTVEYKQKYEPLITKIRQAIQYELKTESIFRGKALNSDFEFINLDDFNTDQIVYSKQCELELETHILGPIKNVAKLEDSKMAIRRSILLYGPYGTGKTLTALVAAKTCFDNGWTFFNVLPGHNIKTAIQFAQKYQPALVFFEDIDQATPHGRTGDVNEILNVVDGFLSKSSKVMTILTTNHTDKIEKAMLRPGRIDAVIKMGDVDEQVMRKMISSYCPDMTKGRLSMSKLLEAAENYTPSFIAEACHRSALYAINRCNGNGNKPEVTTKDIENSLLGLRAQFDLMMSDNGAKAPDSIEEAIFKVVDKRAQTLVGETTEDVRDMMYDEGLLRE